MNVQRIWGADICRDGGSYSLCFDADDGRWYELFLQVRFGECGVPTYLEGVNGGQEVQSLSWAEAGKFTAGMQYDNPRFTELLAVIASEGNAAA